MKGSFDAKVVSTHRMRITALENSKPITDQNAHTQIIRLGIDTKRTKHLQIVDLCLSVTNLSMTHFCAIFDASSIFLFS